MQRGHHGQSRSGHQGPREDGHPRPSWLDEAAARVQRANYDIKVLLSPAWRVDLPISNEGDGPRRVVTGGVEKEQIKPYLVQKDLAPHYGKLLARLFTLPRYDLAANRRFILQSFVGAPDPAPGRTGRLYQEDGLLNERGSAELAAYYITVLKRLRGQILPGRPENVKPAIPQITGPDTCPFSNGCPFSMYSLALSELLAPQTPTFARAVETEKREHAMVRMTSGGRNNGSIVREGVCCPLRHEYQDDHIHSLMPDIISAANAEFAEIAWRIVNDIPMLAPEPRPERLLYKKKEVRDACAVRQSILGAEGSRGFYDALRVVATANLDNASDPKLIPGPREDRDPEVFTQLLARCKEEREAWIDASAIGDRAHHPPYMVLNDLKMILDLPPREAPKPQDTIARRALEYHEAQAAARENAAREKAARAAEGPRRQAPPEPEGPPPRPDISGALRPMHGNSMAPRIVSDAWLKEHAFDFYAWNLAMKRLRDGEEAASSEAAGMVISWLTELYVRHNADLRGDRAAATSVAYAIFKEFRGNPFVLIDQGIAYAPVIESARRQKAGGF